jgi:diadenosine tetraphosphate (Ap4A) HIT family hydrolase
MFESYEPDWDALHQQFQSGPCFICEIVARNPDYPAHIIYEDLETIAFLDKYPVLYGHVLVASRAHKEHVTGDFSIEEYLDLQRRVYQVAEAVRQEIEAERVYLLSLGSQQGNSHVHWHVVPLPGGVPYREQQLAVFRKEALRLPEEEKTSLTRRVRQRIREMNGG